MTTPPHHVALALLLTSLAGCGEPAAAGASPPTDPAPFLAHLGGDQLVLDHFLGKQIGNEATALLIASTPDQRRIALYRADPDSDAPAGYRSALAVDLERHSPYWLYPDPPELADLDGDGVEEILLRFSVGLADRTTRTALILTRRDGSWQALPHPSVLAALRRSTHERVSVYQDDKLALLETSGRKIGLQGVSHGGGYRLVPRPDGTTALLGIAATSEGEADLAPHRTALVMFQLGADFTVDPTWNDGQPLLCQEPAHELDLEPLVARHFAR